MEVLRSSIFYTDISILHIFCFSCKMRYSKKIAGIHYLNRAIILQFSWEINFWSQNNDKIFYMQLSYMQCIHRTYTKLSICMVGITFFSFKTVFPSWRKWLRNAQGQPSLWLLYTHNIFRIYSNLLCYNLSENYAKFRTGAEPSLVQDKLSKHCWGIWPSSSN